VGVGVRVGVGVNVGVGVGDEGSITKAEKLPTLVVLFSIKPPPPFKFFISNGINVFTYKY
jgi:hypothetical protein